MSADGASTLIRGARVFDRQQPQPASNVPLAGRTIADAGAGPAPRQAPRSPAATARPRYPA